MPYRYLETAPIFISEVKDEESKFDLSSTIASFSLIMFEKTDIPLSNKSKFLFI